MRITLFGALVFIALLIGYFYWAGNVPSMAEESLGTRRGYDRAWFYCSALFAVGAGNACFGDKQYGMFPPTSLRWLFVLRARFRYGMFWPEVDSCFWVMPRTASPSPRSRCSFPLARAVRDLHCWCFCVCGRYPSSWCPVLPRALLSASIRRQTAARSGGRPRRRCARRGLLGAALSTARPNVRC